MIKVIYRGKKTRKIPIISDCAPCEARVVTPKHMATVTALGFFLRQARRGGTAHDKHLEAAPTAMGRLGSLFYLRHYSEGRNHSRLSWDEV